MLTSNIDQRENTVYVRFSGRIDHEGIATFQSTLDKIVHINPAVTMIDLSTVSFINSAGINSLFLFYKRMANRSATVRIVGVAEEVLPLFKTIQLDRLIPFEK